MKPGRFAVRSGHKAENGLKNTEFIVSPQDEIIVELAVVNTKKAKGGLKIHVLKAEGQYNKDEISKIMIPIRRKKISRSKPMNVINNSFIDTLIKKRGEKFFDLKKSL